MGRKRRNKPTFASVACAAGSWEGFGGIRKEIGVWVCGWHTVWVCHQLPRPARSRTRRDVAHASKPLPQQLAPHSTVLRPKSIHTALRLSPEVESVFQAELLPPQASAGYWSARPPPGTRRCPHRARTELPFERHSALLCSLPPLPSSLPAVSPPSQRYWARGLFVVGQI